MSARPVEVWIVEVWRQGKYLALAVFEDLKPALRYANDAAKRGCRAVWWQM